MVITPAVDITGPTLTLQTYATVMGQNVPTATLAMNMAGVQVSPSFSTPTLLLNSVDMGQWAAGVDQHLTNLDAAASVNGIVDALQAQGVEPEAVLADKGYASAANREYLKNKGIGDLIQFKGSRGKPVHPLQTKMNRAIATLRYKVEQGFGTMKRRFHLSRARYFGAAKTQAQMAWAALGVNLLKALRKLQSGRLQPCAGSSPS